MPCVRMQVATATQLGVTHLGEKVDILLAVELGELHRESLPGPLKTDKKATERGQACATQRNKPRVVTDMRSCRDRRRSPCSE